jgi:two-component system OmpR family response regulator
MRALIVEDDNRLALAIKRGLEQEGFAVDIAHDGDEGLWLAKEAAFDVVMLDIMLPGRKGDEVCTELRSAGVWTPILMLTARDSDEDHARALDAGADDFLTKPFSYVVLVAHLRALMRRGSRERPSVLRAGDLALDPARHRCWRGETEIELTPRQFSLLEYFMRRAGDVLSKSEIMEHVWDFAFEGDPNVVEVYVSNLRKKIDAPFGRHALKTVRLVGYRLDAHGG